MNERVVELWTRMMAAARRLAAKGTWRDAERVRQRWYAWQERTLEARYGLGGADDREVAIV